MARESWGDRRVREGRERERGREVEEERRENREEGIEGRRDVNSASAPHIKGKYDMTPAFIRLLSDVIHLHKSVDESPYPSC